jgi:hypothetical protein
MGVIMADSRGFVPVLSDRGGTFADPARGPAADAGPARRNALRHGYPAPRLMCRGAATYLNTTSNFNAHKPTRLLSSITVI